MRREAHPRGRAPRASSAVNSRRLAGIALLFALGIAATAVRAQAPHPPAVLPAAGTTSPTRPPIREEGVRWQTLTAPQRQALAPLEGDWAGIDAQRKQKWLSLAARFRTLTPDEQARISARMSEWAKLTPVERGQARMRFEESRQVPATDRNARWQAYQALPAERRKELAARAASAASASHKAPVRPARADGRDNKEAKFNVVPNPAFTQRPRQVAPTIVQAGPGATTTPITRRPTPPAHQSTGMPKIAATPEFVNRSTLLPKRGPQAAAVTPPVAGLTPVAPATTPARPIPASAPR